MIHLLAAAASAVPTPVKQIDMNEAGRVLATLNDWRAILFGSMIINGLLILLVIGLVFVVVTLAAKRSSNDQATLQALQDNTKALGSMSASIYALEAIESRREAGKP